MPALQLFVYGTLKRGYANHARCCGDLADACEARVRGRLYLLAPGYPTLEVPAEDVLGEGSADQTADARRAAETPAPAFTPPRPPWDAVRGELLVFPDAARALAAFDELEDFDPRGESEYRRVLVPVETGGRVVAGWTYGRAGPVGRHVPGGVWDSDRFR